MTRWAIPNMNLIRPAQHTLDVGDKAAILVAVTQTLLVDPLARG